MSDPAGLRNIASGDIATGAPTRTAAPEPKQERDVGQMRILHILDHSLPLHSGYVFRTLGILAAQRARGWRTAHLTTPRHTAESVPVPGPGSDLVEEVDGWRFHRTPAPAGVIAQLPVGRELAEMRATARRLAALVDQVRPDILHAHSPVLNALPALRVGRRRGLPVVYEVRAFWEDAAADHGTSRAGGARYRATRWLETVALKRADAVTTISEGLRRDIVARGVAGDKVAVIPNAVDVELFRPGAEPDAALAGRLGLAGATVLGFLGSFYAYEGLDLLVEALPAVAAARPAVKLLLVGGGPERDRLAALAERCGVADRVVFAGRVPHGAVQAYYDLVDLLVYPRHSIRLTELVTPLKPLEAMAGRRVLLASDVGGHRELIADRQTGYLFKADDRADLARQIVAVLADRADGPAIGAAGRRFVERERSWPASVARYAPVYDRLLG